MVEEPNGKGSHRLFVHRESGKEVWVTVHGHDAGPLGNRILRDAGSGVMATHPIVFERGLGRLCAYVAGLPVYAQGPTRAKAANAIVRTLSSYLEAYPQERPRAEVRGATCDRAAAIGVAPHGWR